MNTVTSGHGTSPGAEDPPPAATIDQALLTRYSCRAFLDVPVPGAQVKQLLELAARSASNSNCQPWQAHVLTGEAKRRLSAALLSAHDAACADRAPEYDYQPAPGDWAEPFRSRRRQFGESLYGGILGLPPGDAAARLAHRRRNYDFFGAPVAIILTISRLPLHGALVDAGQFLQSLMLAARGAGLDTCPQASVIDFSPVLREHLRIPGDQLIVCALALGHADHAHPLNRHRTIREPVDAFAVFYDDACD